ncbi:MAG: transposase [Nitriliruptoraceae bacterium]|nr:transposase [Nitriliruptoraceae bacterium]
MSRLPFSDYNANRAWVELVLLAAVLLAAVQTLIEDPELSVAEPRRLRYTLLHIAARVVRRSRRTHVRLDRIWPWTDVLVAVHRRLEVMAAPAAC